MYSQTWYYELSGHVYLSFTVPHIHFSLIFFRLFLVMTHWLRTNKIKQFFHLSGIWQLSKLDSFISFG